MLRLSGFLLASPEARNFSREDLEQRRPESKGMPTLKYKNSTNTHAQWDEYELFSQVQLNEDNDTESRGPPYKYLVYLIRGRSKLVLLAERRKVAEHVLNYVINQNIFPNLRKISINMDLMISRCSEKDCEFLITSLHGRFAGSSRQLRSLSLYGDDVTSSGVYSNNADLFNFYSCGVGRRLYDEIPRFTPMDDGEILRVGNDGFVSFSLGDRKKALQFIKAVNFIVNGKWIPGWIPGLEESI